MRDSAEVNVSVVVPAHDAERTIGACLDALRDAGVAERNVLVVDDASSDATSEIARDRGVRVIVSQTPLGAAAARNLGVRRSHGRMIVFVDSDVCVASDAIAKIIDAFTLGDAPDALFGSYDDAPPAPGIVSRVRNLLHHHVHQTNAGKATSFWTGLGAIRRDAFEAVGGFAVEQRMMEDIRLGSDLHRAGYRIELRAEIQGAHLKRWTLHSMLRTDLFDRALPWSRMLLADTGGAVEGLNVSRAGKLSVVIAFAIGLAGIGTAAGAVFGVGIALVALVSALTGILALAILNRTFLGLVKRRLGPLNVVPALGLLWLHFVVSGLGYGWAALERVIRRPEARRS